MLDDDEFEEATRDLREVYAPQISRLKESLADAIASGIEHPLCEWLDAVWEVADAHTPGARRVMAISIGVVIRENDGAAVRAAGNADALAFINKYEAILVRIMSEPPS